MPGRSGWSAPCTCCRGRSGCTSCGWCSVRPASTPVHEDPQPRFQHRERPELLAEAPPAGLAGLRLASTQRPDVLLAEEAAPSQRGRPEQIVDQFAQWTEHPVGDRHAHPVLAAPDDLVGELLLE